MTARECGFDESADKDSTSSPATTYESIRAYMDDYLRQSQAAMKMLDRTTLARAAECLTEAIRDRRTIYVCGNGGSAAIANHLLCDFLKGIQTNTPLLPKLISLPANLELTLAIANDIAFEDIFVYPLRTMAEKDDVLLAISSSGCSENVVRAVRWAKDHGLRTIAMTAFEGGQCRKLAEIPSMLTRTITAWRRTATTCSCTCWRNMCGFGTWSRRAFLR